MSLKIVIPSHKRADKVISKKLVVDPILCVAESQAEEYRRLNPECEIVTHPDDVIGLIPKRNWMVKHFGDLFMLDDDVARFVKLFVEKGEQAPIKDKVKITRLINELYEMAELLDVHLFGFSNCTVPMEYREDKWLSLSKCITGCAYGVRGNKNTWWNETMQLKEDFWISCYMKYKERKVLTDQRYNFQQMGTFASQGGLAEIRNQDKERANILALKHYFGDVVHLKKPGSNGRNKTRDKVKFNISVTFPF